MRGLRMLLAISKVVCIGGVLLLFAHRSSMAHPPGSAPLKNLTAVRTEHPPRIDGRLEDPVWQKASASSGFVQMDPHEGELATQQTVVRVLYDDDTIYFGVDCLDSEPEGICTRVTPRDVSWWPCDLIAIVLDTYHDHQNCYAFYTSPLGCQVDLRATEDGWRQDWAWDGVWRSEGVIHDSGWSAEVAIPFKTLRFSHKPKQTWGINFQRYRYRGGEDSNWMPITVEQGGSNLKVSLAGHLMGLERIRPGLHIELLPYATAQFRSEGEGRDWRTGIDLKYGLAPDVTLDATVHPDFAHIEADEDQINLTRFELYLEEKRPFFLEGRDLFDVMDLFYSRRVHDPVAAFKLTGKVSGWAFGLLGAQDKDPGTNPYYTVVRVKKDLMKRSSVGVLWTLKHRPGSSNRSAAGSDLVLGLGENFRLRASLRRTFNPGDRKKVWYKEASIDHALRGFSFGGGLSHADRGFDTNHTGFWPRDPVDETEVWAYVTRRFELDRHGIERIEVEQNFSTQKRSDDEKGSWSWGTIDVGLTFLNKDWIRLKYERRYSLYQPHGAEPDTLGFRGYRLSLRAGLLKEKLFPIWPELWIEDYYDYEDHYHGQLRGTALWGNGTVRENLSVDLGISSYWEYFPSGSFDENKWVCSIRGTYLYSRDIFLRSFIQINPETESHDIHFLFSYTYRPGSRVYLAYNTEVHTAGDRFKLAEPFLFAKIAYLWSL